MSRKGRCAVSTFGTPRSGEADEPRLIRARRGDPGLRRLRAQRGHATEVPTQPIGTGVDRRCGGQHRRRIAAAESSAPLWNSWRTPGGADGAAGGRAVVLRCRSAVTHPVRSSSTCRQAVHERIHALRRGVPPDVRRRVRPRRRSRRERSRPGWIFDQRYRDRSSSRDCNRDSGFRRSGWNQGHRPGGHHPRVRAEDRPAVGSCSRLSSGSTASPSQVSTRISTAVRAPTTATTAIRPTNRTRTWARSPIRRTTQPRWCPATTGDQGRYPDRRPRPCPARRRLGDRGSLRRRQRQLTGDGATPIPGRAAPSGPALTFGYLAALHVAGAARPRHRTPERFDMPIDLDVCPGRRAGAGCEFSGAAATSSSITWRWGRGRSDDGCSRVAVPDRRHARRCRPRSAAWRRRST